MLNTASFSFGVEMPVSLVSNSEDELGGKWDNCLSDTLIKIGSGLGVGIVFSVFIFKRKTWPLVFGSGVGLGMGYSNCQHGFNSPFVEKIHKVVLAQKSKEIKPDSPVTVSSTTESTQEK